MGELVDHFLHSLVFHCDAAQKTCTDDSDPWELISRLDLDVRRALVSRALSRSRSDGGVWATTLGKMLEREDDEVSFKRMVEDAQKEEHLVGRLHTLQVRRRSMIWV